MLTRFSCFKIVRDQSVYGKHQTVVVVAHGVAGQMSRVAKRREFLFFDAPFALRFVADYVGRHEVVVV